MTTPPPSAPINGLPGNLRANLGSAHLNQLLGAPALTRIYTGSAVLQPWGGSQFTLYPLTGTDYSQPFALSGTTIGRVTLPLMPVNNGADVLVSLYADSGGSPNIAAGAITSTLVPAAYLNQVVAVDGLENATSPLQTPANNTISMTGGQIATGPWLAPASDASGTIANSVVTSNGNFIAFVGGFTGGGTPIASVNTAQSTGGGAVSQPVPQTPLPEALAIGAAAVAGGQTLVYCGGNNSAGTVVADTWAASWDANTGVIGSWSAQPALPQAVYHASACSWNTTMYLVGGVNGSGTTLNTVYRSTVTNGQVGSWQTTAPLPAALCDAFSAVVGNWLVVTGGRTSLGSSTGLTATYYAAINSDGSLGVWQTGPSLLLGEYGFASGWSVCTTTDTVVIVGGHTDVYGTVQTLSFGAAGPAPFWYRMVAPDHGDISCFAVSDGVGQWNVVAPIPYRSLYFALTLIPTPMVSVPLPATGLTNGATYHVVVSQGPAASASDGVMLGILDDQPLPLNVLQSVHQANSWSVVANLWSVPMYVNDLSTAGLDTHAWLGSGQSWSSQFYNARLMLAGITETTSHPNVPLNSNPTFTSGVSPWTAVNGTITQSSAQTHGGYTFSGLLTPTGGFSLAYATSELFPITQTPWGNAQWVMPTGWFYSPTGWSSFSLSVNWYDSSQAYITTSSATVGLPAATWTQVTNRFQPPAAAAYGQLVPTEGGTPGATNLLYMSGVQLLLTPETVGALTSAATVNYAASTYFPPTGVTQLL